MDLSLKRFFGATKQTEVEEVKPKRKKKLPADMIPDPTYRVSMQMQTLKDAVNEAIDVYHPNRNQLLLLYHWVTKDSHLKSQTEIAINKVAGLPFKVWKGDTEVDDLKYHFKKPWFDDYIRVMIEAEQWGYTLVEFAEMEKGQFRGCKAFPRRYVLPEKRHIITHPSALSGVPYEGILNDLYMIEAGSTHDIGTLELIAKEVIWKNFARVDWSDFNERFGKPLIDIATDTDDQEEVMKRARFAASFGTNGWIVRDIDDTVNIIEAKNIGGNAENFEKMIKMCNEEISKVVNGQSGTSDEKSFVGSAEVGERILNDYTRARVRRISNHINYTLIPFLVKYGYPLRDCTFEFEIEELNPVQNTEPAAIPGRGVSLLEKKNFPGSPPQQLSLNLREAKAAIKLDDWLSRYFNNKPAGIDRDIWRMNFEQLLKGITDVGIDFSGTYKYAELAGALRENAAVFAAFKNHKEQDELARLLVDDSGKPRSLAEFRKAARPLTETYNREYLETEYRQAQASAQMAEKWEGFKEEAGLYPNLRYDAVMDSATRDSHRELDGTVLPMNDPFWGSNYPPNGWGCRCDVVQTDEPIKATSRRAIADAGFTHNPGQTGKLFAEDNGYQKDVDGDTAEKLSNEARQLLDDYLKEAGNE